MKIILLFLIANLISLSSHAQINPTGATNEIMIQGGIGLGSLLAVVISWDRNHSIIWAIIHAMCGWIYVIYYIAIRNRGDRL